MDWFNAMVSEIHGFLSFIVIMSSNRYLLTCMNLKKIPCVYLYVWYIFALYSVCLGNKKNANKP